VADGGGADSRARGPGGRGAGLTREAIVATALELMDRHGVEWLTMRRLADHIGVRAGALYWHFSNKDELCQAVVERVANDLEWRAVAVDAPVRDQIEAHVRQLRAHWRRHPTAVTLGRRFPPSGAGAFGDVGVELLGRLGYRGDEAKEQWRALVWIVLGFFFVEDSLASSVHHHPLEGAPGRFEVDVGSGPSLLDTDALFDRVLDLALDGLTAGAPRRR
jgi:AcrR family transcriptional regulator